VISARPLLRMAAVMAALMPVAATAEVADWCAAPPGATAITQAQEHTAARINEGGPLTIVAVGSSSTVGVGASDPSLGYPSRLEAELRTRFPGSDIRVLNRGKSGEDAPEELARLGSDVVAVHPDLAIWQVGTNAVLRRDNLEADAEWMRQGVELLQRNGIDVVLMDLQFAPRVIERSATPAMETLIADTAQEAHVGLYRRFALMRYWQHAHPAEAAAMIAPDGLHMTDVSYGCLARDLAVVLASNWLADAKIAQRPHGSADSIAGLRSEPQGELPRSQETSTLRPNDANPRHDPATAGE
jgi:acyl-CoA thioesterase-1